MNTAPKSRPLIFIIIFLLLTNIAVLAWLFWPNKNKSAEQGSAQRNGMVMALQNEVGFSDSQVEQYKQIKEKQWKILRPMFDDIRKAKDSLYRLLSDESVNDSVISQRAETIGQNQKALDLQAFNHFREVRSLCMPEQRPKYDSLVLKMIKKMGKPQSRRNNESSKDEKSK
jgi:Spy/CpxP family protein refolding chaperone